MLPPRTAAAAVALCGAAAARAAPPPLPPPPDCATRETPSADAGEQMCYLLARNEHLYDIHTPIAQGGHDLPHHNHVHYQLMALWRLGANATVLQRAFDTSAPGLDPALPPTGAVNESSWRALIGADATTNASTNYVDYVSFYRGRQDRVGSEALLAEVLPLVVDGVASDLFHGTITLGYYYESGDARILAEGLAWMSTAYAPLPPLSAAPAVAHTALPAALARIRGDARLPQWGKISSDRDLAAKFATLSTQYQGVLAEYDLATGAAPSAAATADAVRSLSAAVIDLYVATGSCDFYVLHVVTATRAAQASLPHVADAAVRAAWLRRHWQAVVYVYVAHGRPDAAAPAPAAPLPAWPEIVERSTPFFDVHLTKLVYLSRDNEPRWGAARYRQAAAETVLAFEGGEHRNATSRGWCFA